MYYDFFFACTFIFTGAEAESQTLAHDSKNKPVRQIFFFTSTVPDSPTEQRPATEHAEKHW